MSKIKTSVKELKNSFCRVFYTGYCDLQCIMYHNPDFYTCGIYGWNMDCYYNKDHDILICTGYRGMFGKRIPSDLIEKYNKKAAKIVWSGKNYAKKRLKLEKDFYKALNDILIEEYQAKQKKEG